MANLMEIETKFEANGEEVKLTGGIVKNYLVRGNEAVTDQEVVMFINLCKFQKLNPFLNECYLVKFKGSPAQLITSKEAFMKRAERASNYDGFKAGIIVQRDKEVLELIGSFSLKNDILLGAWCDVYKNNRKFPCSVKINLDEFNKGQSTWRNMPKTMIRKTAIVQALREAFPEDLGAMYTEDEVQISAEYEVKEEIKEKANTKILELDNIKPQEVKKIKIVEAEPTEINDNIPGQMILEEPGF